MQNDVKWNFHKISILYKKIIVEFIRYGVLVLTQKVSPDVDLEECRKTLNLPTEAEIKESYRRHIESQKYLRLPIIDWPEFSILWDCSETSQHFAFDGEIRNSRQEFNKCYPDGLSLRFVFLSDLDEQLCEFNRRTPEEVWGVGIDGKAATIILDWVEERKITPPALTRTNGTSEICLLGGNHRLAVARAKGESVIPVLIDPEHFTFINAKLKLDKEPPTQ